MKAGGITLRFAGDTAVQVGGDYWYFPLMPDQTLIIGLDSLELAYAEFVAHNRGELAKSGHYLGVWLHPTSHQYYFDINIRSKTKEQALERIEQINKASKRQILAAYNPARDETAIV